MERKMEHENGNWPHTADSSSGQLSALWFLISCVITEKLGTDMEISRLCLFR